MGTVIPLSDNNTLKGTEKTQPVLKELCSDSHIQMQYISDNSFLTSWYAVKNLLNRSFTII